jgi:uncharacterized membrane protein YdjX (TVP38/TMEM64 family)
MSRPRAAVLVTVVILLLAAGWLVPIREWMLQLAESVRDAGELGILLFFIAYIISTVALLPGSLLTMGAGFAYGPIYGLLIASPASVTSATIAFLLGRTVFRDWVREKVAASPRARAVDRAVDREGFKLVLLLRLSPLIPFNLLNYALSLSGVSLGRYVLASAIGMLPGTFLYVYLGSLVTTAAELTTAAAPARPVRLVFYVAGLAATLLVVFVVTRAARRALAEQLGPEPG